MAEGAALLPPEPKPLAHRDRPGHRDAPVAPCRVGRVEPIRGREEMGDSLRRDPFRLPLLVPFRLHRRTIPDPVDPAGSSACRRRKNADAPSIALEPPLCVEPDRLGEDPVLLDQDPGREGLRVVVLAHGHAGL